MLQQRNLPQVGKTIAICAATAVFFFYGCRTQKDTYQNTVRQGVERELRAEEPRDSTIARCTRELISDSTNTNALLARAICNYRKYEYVSVRKDIERLLSLEPNNAYAYLYLGMLEKNKDSALAFLSKAIELAPNMAEAYLQRAYKQVNYEKRCADFEKAILFVRDDEARAWVYWQKADAEYNYGDNKSAMKDLAMAIVLDPYYAKERLLNDIIKELPDPKTTISAFTKIIDARPEVAIAYLERGKAYFEVGKFRKALNNFAYFINGAAENCSKPKEIAEAYLFQARVFSKLGNVGRAIEGYTVSIGLFENDEAYYERGAIYYSQKRYMEAIADYEKTSGSYNRKPYYDGTKISELGKIKYGDAIEYYTRKIESNPTANAYYVRARVHQMQWDKLEAIADFEKAFELGYKDKEALKVLAGLYELTWQWGKAAEIYQGMLSCDPMYNFISSLADAYYYEGNYEKAVDILSMRISSNGTNSRLYEMRGTSYFMLGQMAEAISDFSTAIELENIGARSDKHNRDAWGNGFEKNSELFLMRGKAYDKIGNEKAALADYLEAASLDERKHSPGIGSEGEEALELATKILVKNGEFRQALLNYEEFTGFEPQAWALYARGHIYFVMGDLENAKKDYEKAVNLDPKYAKEPYK